MTRRDGKCGQVGAFRAKLGVELLEDVASRRENDADLLAREAFAEFYQCHAARLGGALPNEE